jgi:hypothetical protein
MARALKQHPKSKSKKSLKKKQTLMKQNILVIHQKENEDYVLL